MHSSENVPNATELRKVGDGHGCERHLKGLVLNRRESECSCGPPSRRRVDPAAALRCVAIAPDPGHPRGTWHSQFAGWGRLARSRTSAIAHVTAPSHTANASQAPSSPPSCWHLPENGRRPRMETRSSWGAAPLHPPTRGPGNGQAPCLPHGNGRPAPTWVLTGSSRT